MPIINKENRCSWCDASPELLHYHDNEWGFPVDSDQRLFEKLCLETFQSGLSWRTVLAKRNNFRLAFHDFDIKKVAYLSDEYVEQLLQNKGIIRNERKIHAVINNAKRAQELIAEEKSLASFLWRYEPDENTLPPPETETTSTASIALAKELKKRGWKFLGPTTLHAFMQSMGFINDHAEHCLMREKIHQARQQFKRP